MNTEKFSEAQEVYNAGDYRRSARLFLDAVEKGTPVGNGLAYHMAGNSFMRLKRYSDATVVFEHALRDDTYKRRGAVEANLANAYVRTGDYDSAIAHYEAALELGDKQEAYRYYQGTAQAYMQQEKFDLAAIAYKHAALDGHNPTPGKSLVNLGLAMMAGGNAKGAIEAYQAALASPDYENKGRALLNLGVAYHSLGMWKETVEALTEAKQDPNYHESELASGTLADAQHRFDMEAAVAESDQELEDLADEDELVDPVEAYLAQTAATQAVEAVTPEEEPAGIFDAEAEDGLSSFADDPAEGTAAEVSSANASSDELYPRREVKVGNAEDVERFFSLSEKEAAQQGRDQLKKERGRFHWLKWVLIVVLLVAGIGGGGAALYFTGQGYPSPDTTVTRLLESYAAGRSIAEYWTFGSQQDIESKMVVVPIPQSFTIDDVTLGASASSVRASITTESDEIFIFTFQLSREGIGWKVHSIVMEGLDSTPADPAPVDDSLTADDAAAVVEDPAVVDDVADTGNADQYPADDQPLDEGVDLGAEAP
ncbi:MAG: tetratricopeptide repeat protein [Coriobacteriia bacterium]|nr:tetratricopeptide repeat protein [Coriobacteriia bacterium]MCL2537213.1 tetratricopeptide repeat protein [Coriobacteriia bacterium]